MVLLFGLVIICTAFIEFICHVIICYLLGSTVCLFCVCEIPMFPKSDVSSVAEISRMRPGAVPNSNSSRTRPGVIDLPFKIRNCLLFFYFVSKSRSLCVWGLVNFI